MVTNNSCKRANMIGERNTFTSHANHHIDANDYLISVGDFLIVHVNPLIGDANTLTGRTNHLASVNLLIMYRL